jgi:hypothetical protein
MFPEVFDSRDGCFFPGFKDSLASRWVLLIALLCKGNCLHDVICQEMGQPT